MRLSTFLCTLPLILGGCEFGNIFSKKTPDEFRIMTRAPLTMPPNYDLTPPVKGADVGPYSEAAVKPENEAEKALFGKNLSSRAPLTSGEAALLKNADADKAPKDIAAKLDYETGQRVKEDESLLDDILFWREPAGADVLDVNNEKKRLQKKSR